MKTIQKTIYNFDELDDDFRMDGLDYEWWDTVYEDANTIGAIIGIDIDNIWFSGFSSQGDGACLEGAYSYKPGSVRAIREYAPLDTELHKITQSLYELQRPHFYRIRATVKQRGHYNHEYCTEIDVNYGVWYDYPPIETQEAIKDCLRDYMRWIYRTLEREYEYLTSDEAITETIEANGYEFDEDGNMV